MSTEPPSVWRHRSQPRDGLLEPLFVDRAEDRPRPAHAVEIAGDRESAVADHERGRSPFEPGRPHQPQREIAFVEDRAVVELSYEVGQMVSPAGTNEYLYPELFSDRFGPTRMIRLGAGQRDPFDRPASPRRFGDRALEPRPGRIARVDEHESLPPDEVAIDGLTGDPATRGHPDADDVGGNLLDLHLTERARRQRLAHPIDRLDIHELAQR